MEKKRVTKTFKVYEIVALVNWYEGFYKSKLRELPIKTQWLLDKNIKTMVADAKDFMTFREGIMKNIQEKYFTDEKTEDFESEQKDENGNIVRDENGKVVMQKMKKVKDEFLKEYQKELEGINNELESVASEEKEYAISLIDIDGLIEGLPDDSNIDIDDLNMIAAFNKEDDE
jgi:hypothetical protein